MDYLQATKEVVLIATGAIGSYVALKGLSIWKQQIAGKTEYEIARKLLRAVYMLREEIDILRAPFLTNQDQTIHEVYQAKWTKLIEVKTRLLSELLEAEVLWGQEIRSKYENINRLIQDLYWAISLHLESLKSNDPATYAPDELKKTRSIMFTTENIEDDAYRNKINEEIKQIEEFVKPHLKIQT